MPCRSAPGGARMSTGIGRGHALRIQRRDARPQPSRRGSLIMSQNQANWKYRDFYDRQLEFIARNDIEGLIHNQYTEDAELLNFNYYIKGAPALIEYFKTYVASLGYIKLLSTDNYTEGDDSIFFESTVETAGGVARV